MDPLISIVVPVKDNDDTLPHCLAALKRVDYPHDRLQLIVVDGGSTDRTIEVAASFNAEILRDEGKGRAGALNVGIDHAKGDFIAFTDADCSPDKAWLRSLLREFKTSDIAGVGGPNLVPISEKPFTRAIEFVSYQSPYAERFDKEEEVETLAGCNSMYRSEVLRTIVPLPEVRDYEDAIMNFRIREAGFRLMAAPQAIVWHYRHYSEPYRFLKKMALLGAGEVQGTRIERGLSKPLHVLEGLSLVAFFVIAIVLGVVSLRALIWFIAIILGVLLILLLKCLVETRSITVALYVPLVTVIEAVGYSFGFIKGMLKRR